MPATSDFRNARHSVYHPMRRQRAVLFYSSYIPQILTVASETMSLIDRATRPKMKFPPQAYLFVTEALKVAQDQAGKLRNLDESEESAHISGAELLEGVRILGSRMFGMMAPTVFRLWGIESTHDFGRVVFDLVERGELRKTDEDQLTDFDGIYEFNEVFLNSYLVDTTKAFRQP